MITQLGGGGAVAWTVIDEETILGECLLLSEDEPEKHFRRLHHLTFITQIKPVEIIVEGMTVTGELIRPGESHHEWIGIGKQQYTIATLSEVKKIVKVAFRHVVAIALPTIGALIPCELVPYMFGEFLSELFIRDQSLFDITEYAGLRIWVQKIVSIWYADFLETADGLLLVDGHDDATEIKDYCPYHCLSEKIQFILARLFKGCDLLLFDFIVTA